MACLQLLTTPSRTTSVCCCCRCVIRGACGRDALPGWVRRCAFGFVSFSCWGPVTSSSLCHALGIAPLLHTTSTSLSSNRQGNCTAFPSAEGAPRFGSTAHTHTHARTHAATCKQHFLAWGKQGDTLQTASLRFLIAVDCYRFRNRIGLGAVALPELWHREPVLGGQGNAAARWICCLSHQQARAFFRFQT